MEGKPPATTLCNKKTRSSLDRTASRDLPIDSSHIARPVSYRNVPLRRPVRSLGGYRVEHTGTIVAVAIFEELVGGACHCHLVIEPELRGRPKTRQIFHRCAKDAHMGRMRLRPAFERSETFPPAHAVGFFGWTSGTIQHRHVAVGEATDRAALVTGTNESFLYSPV
jgi:hypothetical protein